MNLTLVLRLLVIVPALCLGGCIAVVAGGAAAGGYLLGKDERSIEQITEDAQITTRVKSALIRNEQIRALDINVDTYENQVILHGQVENRWEEELAVSIALSSKGVSKVDSRLRVVPVIVNEIQN